MRPSIAELRPLVFCATCGVTFAAAHGTLIDNRRHSKIEADLLYEVEAWVARLKDMQAEREKAMAANVA
ncbi:hypothetical protein LB543_27015 [Mesorhizobium sp. ESP7-2]|uniref:hypothetical protein n=1 Tax=Mesorhizobium sp. ESP7-2 TaxID=2876622 RepID=UPI001CC9B42D|nr:hypothetical protein [Mesorhizobium sp. ESP7-2]MBZ9710356.1 hypothetical protein [Mesorhizobium sp. ESP7-2]